MKHPFNDDILKEIASELEIGMRCFYDKNTGEILSYPKDIEDTGLEEDWEDIIEKVESDPKNYFEFKDLDSTQAFSVMSDFVNEITHIPTHSKFADALSRKKPFANFNNLINYSADLRQEWFGYKNKSLLASVKTQADEFSEYATTIKQSFNQDFCHELEYHLSRTFQNSPDIEINKIWCDGVGMPHDDKQLNREYVLATAIIETEAWIGVTGQEKYQMTIILGKLAIKKCENGLELTDCLPEESSLKWISLDAENKSICLKLN